MVALLGERNVVQEGIEAQDCLFLAAGSTSWNPSSGLVRSSELFKRVNFLQNDRFHDEKIKFARQKMAECEGKTNEFLTRGSMLRKNMSKFIVRHLPPAEGNRICPSCMREFDVRLTLCTNCRGRAVVWRIP